MRLNDFEAKFNLLLAEAPTEEDRQSLSDFKELIQYGWVMGSRNENDITEKYIVSGYEEAIESMLKDMSWLCSLIPFHQLNKEEKEKISTIMERLSERH